MTKYVNCTINCRECYTVPTEQEHSPFEFQFPANMNTIKAMVVDKVRNTSKQQFVSGKENEVGMKVKDFRRV